MTTTRKRFKQANVLQLTFPIFTRGVPDQVRLRDCNLGILDHDGQVVRGKRTLISGGFGFVGKQHIMTAAARWSHEASNRPRPDPESPDRVLMLDCNYYVDNYHMTRELARKDLVEETGWLNLDRIQADYRDQLKKTWSRWIIKDLGAPYWSTISNFSLSEIARLQPQYVFKMMSANPALVGVVHPVTLEMDPKQSVMVATVRYDPERIEDPVVRFLPAVKVIV